MILAFCCLHEVFHALLEGHVFPLGLLILCQAICHVHDVLPHGQGRPSLSFGDEHAVRVVAVGGRLSP